MIMQTLQFVCTKNDITPIGNVLKMIMQTLHLDSNAITTIQTNAFQVFFFKLTSSFHDIHQSWKIIMWKLWSFENLLGYNNKNNDDNNNNNIILWTLWSFQNLQGYGEHIKNLWLQNNQWVVLSTNEWILKVFSKKKTKGNLLFCSISTIEDDAFDDLHSLQWLKLWNNNLQTLHYELMEPVLDTLIHLDIHSEPLFHLTIFISCSNA